MLFFLTLFLQLLFFNYPFYIISKLKYKDILLLNIRLYKNTFK